MSQGAGRDQSDDRRVRNLSFEELYDSHDRLVYARAMEALRDHHLAEDVVQETFLRVDRALSRGERPEYPTAWILTIARNEIIRIAGRRGHVVPLQGEPEVQPSQEKVDELDEHRKVRDTLGGMNEDEARLLSDRYLEDRSPDTLRRREGLSGSGLFKRLRKAKESFRRRFGRSSRRGGGEGE
jgi:RNA polymerase sigma-70 factor (ECF subfamily)